jgi:fido (protein-threonine AMPylation protein)
MEKTVDKGSQIVFAEDRPSQTISNAFRRGELRQIARGIYTIDLDAPMEAVVKAHWRTIVARRFPGAVITDKSVRTAGPVDGYLWLAHDARDRDLDLPGIKVIARRGAGPQPGDIAMPGGLHLASTWRALSENAAESRSRQGRPRRTMELIELDGWIEHLCAQDGEERLRRYRRDAESLASVLGVPQKRIDLLGERIGLALGTADVPTANQALAARGRGAPFDPSCIERCDLLVAALSDSAPQSRPGLDPSTDAFGIMSFYEAYFSNYIEGTTFDLDEARRIVYDDELIPNRHEDSHDVLGTFRLVSDHVEMSRLAADPAEFVEQMRERHAVIMEGRPLIAGRLKEQLNHAGNTTFVAPHLVTGTLSEGWRRLAELDTAWKRAVYALFLVGEVHPFADGNGRIARVVMNSELVAGDQSKIIIPTSFRNDYLGALRRLTRSDDPSVFIKTMRFAHDYTSRIDWSTEESALVDLNESNAFTDEEDARLRMPRSMIDAKSSIERQISATPDKSASVAAYVRNGRPVSGYRKPHR